MRTEINTDGIIFPYLDLSELNPDQSDDGRLFRHNGDSTIDIENGDVSDKKGIYSWDDSNGWWVPSGRYSMFLEGYQSSDFAQQTDHEKLRTDHDDLQTNHDNLRTDHDNLQVDHDNLEVNHNNLRTDHDDLQVNHDNLHDNFDLHENSTDNPHGVTYTQVDAIPASDKGSEGGVAELGSDQKVPDSQLPSLAVTEVHVLDTDGEEKTDLTEAEQGDMAVYQWDDDRGTYILSGDDPTLEDNWSKVDHPDSPVQSVYGRTGDVSAETGDYHIDQIDDSVHTSSFQSLEADVSDLEDRVSFNETDISNLDDRVSINEVDISDLQTDYDNLRSDHDTLDNNFTSHETNTNNPHEITADEIGGVTSDKVGNIYVGQNEPDSPEEYDIWIRI